jgi:hypothetical protein
MFHVVRDPERIERSANVSPSFVVQFNGIIDNVGSPVDALVRQKAPASRERERDNDLCRVAIDLTAIEFK